MPSPSFAQAARKGWQTCPRERTGRSGWHLGPDQAGSELAAEPEPGSAAEPEPDCRAQQDPSCPRLPRPGQSGTARHAKNGFRKEGKTAANGSPPNLRRRELGNEETVGARVGVVSQIDGLGVVL